MPQSVNGTVKKIRYYNESNHFMVLSILIDHEHTLSSFVGFGFKPTIDTMYTFSGDYGNDQRYGLQFRFESLVPYRPNGKNELIRYFSSAAFKGIGPVMASKIVDTLGEDAIEKIKTDPTILEQVGLSERQTSSILTTLFIKDDGFHDNLTFLNQCGLAIDQSHLIYQTYKADTKTILANDPFRPYYDLADIDFDCSLKIAKALEFEADDDTIRLGYFIHYIRHYVETSGCVYVDHNQLNAYGLTKLHIDEMDVDRLIQKGSDEALIIVEQDRIYPFEQYSAELAIAAYLKVFPFEPLEKVDHDMIKTALDTYGQTNGLIYDQSQLHAIYAAFDHDLLLICGGPGTGKTSITKAIVDLSREFYPMATIVAAAPTGRAAKRLSQVLGIHASTLHALLGYSGQDEGFNRNGDHPLQADIVIIDECSMVDAILFASLCTAGSRIKKIIMIGDVDQLPSVGAGNILDDLTHWDGMTTVYLEHNYRQDGSNHITRLAKGVLNHTIDTDCFDGNVTFIQCADTQIAYHVLNVVQSLQASNDNYIVTSAMHERSGGVKALNALLQPLHGPFSGPSVNYGYTTYHVGDTILQTKNDIEQYVFNGDIGQIIAIHPIQSKKPMGMMIDAMFDDQIVSYDRLHYDHIRLAYALTIHKLQGNEFDTVVLVVPKCHSAMFTTNLLYTAITRAKHRLILIGDLDHFIKGAYRNMKPRQTTLLKRLQNTL